MELPDGNIYAPPPAEVAKRTIDTLEPPWTKRDTIDKSPTEGFACWRVVEDGQPKPTREKQSICTPSKGDQSKGHTNLPPPKKIKRFDL